MKANPNKYARALFETYQPSLLEEKAEILMTLAQVMAAKETQEFFKNPAISAENKEKLAIEVCGSLAAGDNNFRNFVILVVQNGVVPLLPEIAEKFKKLLAAWRKSLELVITTAHEIPASEKQTVLQSLQKDFGSSLTAVWQVNQELIGGFTVQSGDRLLDSSVAGALAKMKNSLLA